MSRANATTGTGIGARARDLPAIRPAAILAGIVLLGFVLRIYRLGDRSLWLDEGLTVYHARGTWPQVLGLEGWYVEGPPLYYVLTKAAGSIFPEVIAGRLVSVIAGILTIIVVWALARELVDGRTGLVAAFIVAIAPLHIWYSQEARQYAVVILFVATAYLALFKVLNTGERKWVAVYALALALAMYTDYSALYALAWQPLILLAALRRDRRRVVLAAAGIAIAVVAYLPWVPQVLDTVNAIGQTRDYLTVNRANFVNAVQAVVGLHGVGPFYSPEPLTTAWLLSWLVRPLFATAAVAAVSIGLVALARRSPEALLCGIALLFGTVILAVAVTVFLSPGFAERTVLAATIGWAVVCAAAATFGFALLRGSRGWRRLVGGVGLLSVVVLVAGTAFTTAAVIRGADKQHWRDLAQDVGRVASLGYPVVLYPGAAMNTQVDLYQPGKVVGTPLHVEGDQPITADALATGVGPPPGAVWLAYFPFVEIDDRRQELEGLGYRPVLHRYYWNPLYLDLYTRGNEPAGSPIPIPAASELDPSRTEIDADGSLYRLDASVSLPHGAELDTGALLTCLLADGTAAGDRTPTRDRVLLLGNGQAQEETFAALCPEGTARLLIDLSQTETVGATFESLRLSRIPLE